MVYKLPSPEAKPPKLNANNVPLELHKYIGLAEKYGISDDSYRIDVLRGLDEGERRELIEFIDKCDEKLFEWLAGPESSLSNPSNEYITFTSLVMAADYVR